MSSARVWHDSYSGPNALNLWGSETSQKKRNFFTAANAAFDLVSAVLEPESCGPVVVMYADDRGSHTKSLGGKPLSFDDGEFAMRIIRLEMERFRRFTPCDQAVSRIGAVKLGPEEMIFCNGVLPDTHCTALICWALYSLQRMTATEICTLLRGADYGSRMENIVDVLYRVAISRGSEEKAEWCGAYFGTRHNVEAQLIGRQLPLW